MSVRKIILICLILLISGCTKIAKDELRTPEAQSSKEPISTPTTTETKASAKSVLAPLAVSKFRFVAFGDYQGGADVILKSLRCQTGCPEPDFYINTGDIATLSLFGNKFPYGKLYPARGNNDSAAFWASVYPMSGQQNNYYSFTLFNTHFVMLYSGTSDASDQFPAKSNSPNCINPSHQTDWVYCDLEKVRNDASVDNIIVVLHMPPLSFSGYGSNTAESQVLTPIFKTNPKLRAVLSGHNHFFQRLQKDGINYLVIGGAGATLYDPDPNPHTEVKKQAKQYHFAIFDVDGSKVTLSVMGYDDNQKVFAPIEKVDLSCKNGDSREQACSVGGRIGIRTDICVNGAWNQGLCRLSRECINGDQLCVQGCGIPPGLYYKTCVNGFWKVGSCKRGYCQ